METGAEHVAHPFVRHIPPWRRLPASTWTGLIVGIGGLFVRVDTKTEVRTPTSYSCDYLDVAGFAFAAVLVLAAVLGWVTWTKRRPVERAPQAVMAALTVLFVALAVVHLLRGTGTVMSKCPS